jgi:dephospho-CoA kinase
MSATTLIAITGGIGSGKSVVSNILRTMGYYVYDCDSRAKMLMNNNADIINGIATQIGRDAIIHADNTIIGGINRKRLAEIVFNDKAKLLILNSLVHSAVKSDINCWRKQIEQQFDIRSQHNIMPLFIETAIARSSGINSLVDELWWVDAPTELRIARASKRDGATAQQIEARINSQTDEMLLLQEHANLHIIRNDDTTPLLPQLHKLLLHSEKR